MGKDIRTYNHITMRAREEGQVKKLEGLAVPYETSIVFFYDQKEIIARGALTEALEKKERDIHLVVGHDIEKTVASTRNGTLQLTEKDDGLYFSAVLSDTQRANDLYSDVKSGLIKHMSIGFNVGESKYNRETKTNTITKIERLYEISAVTEAAYQSTSVAARSAHIGARAEIQSEILKSQKIILQTGVKK